MPTRSLPDSAPLGTPLPLPTSAVDATPASATPATVSDILAARGAPSRVFTVVDGTLWSIASSGRATRLFTPRAGSAIVAIDPDPSGQQVAVLLSSAAPDRQIDEVLILASDGETVGRLANLEVVPATPGPPQPVSVAEAIDWSPQGDRALVSFRNGAIFALPLNDDADQMELIGRVGAGTVVNPAWSPTGERVGFISVTDSQRARSLSVLDVNSHRVDTLIVPTDGRFVVDFAWMPDGNTLLFTEGGELGGAVGGIDLWRIDADGANRELVVSAGTVAPVARVTNVRPSSDGRSVAYSVQIPGPDGPRADSVWVRDLESHLGFKIALPSVDSVDDIWWTDQGLVIAVTTQGNPGERTGAQELLEVRHDGQVRVLWAAPVPAGTPISGTPAATPQPI
ncbi:MAG: hypothetical protein H0V00_01410 [Chloroflexia bacterium]|nr:hypothetical protein [Chloroflexia bacterium]